MKPLIWTDYIDSDFSAKFTKYASRGGRLLYLNSRGGHVDHMCAALDLMDVGGWTVIGTGSIMSAAVPILASADKGSRCATPRTRFMIHLPKVWSFGAATSDELETESAELRLVEDLYCGVLGTRTKKPKRFWLERMRTKKDWYLGVKEALELGLIDHVVRPDQAE